MADISAASGRSSTESAITRPLHSTSTRTTGVAWRHERADQGAERHPGFERLF
jgi:hypothetical protein